MDTDSTPTTAAVPDHLRDLYRILRHEGEEINRAALAEHKRQSDERAAAERAKRDAEWAGPLAAIRAAMPPVLHDYAAAPVYAYSDYESGVGTYYRAVVLNLPGVAPIYAWHGMGQTNFEAARYKCTADEDGTWSVVAAVSNEHLHYWDTTKRSFAVAFADAVTNEALRPAVEAEAARRNAIAAQLEHVDLTPEQDAMLDATKRDEADALLFNNAEHDLLAAGLLLIVHELHRCADALENVDSRDDLAESVRIWGGGH